MMLVGGADAWLASFKSLEEKMADAMEAVWPQCIDPLHARDGSNALEDHITSHLVEALIRTRRIPGRIIQKYSLRTVDAQQNVKLSAEIDFVLTIGDDEDFYLACECKRLNVPYATGTQGLAGKYVEEGLARFISGQYSDGLPLAMMLGYVMDAQVDVARNRLGEALKKVRVPPINLKSIRNAPAVQGRPARFFTIHDTASKKHLEVSHTLLAWPAESPTLPAC